MHLKTTGERLLRLRDAAKLPWLPRRFHRQPTEATLRRWHNKGCLGRHLEIWVVKRAWYTTEGALRRFIDDEAIQPTTAKAPTPEPEPSSRGELEATEDRAASRASKTPGRDEEGVK